MKKKTKKEENWLDSLYDHKTHPLKIIWWRICGFFELFHPKYRYRDIKYFIQRGRRGYSDSDVWDLDGYLAEWLPKALKHLRTTGMSYPGQGISIAQWKQILLKMEKGFKSHNKINEGDFMVEKYKKKNGRPMFFYDKKRLARYEKDVKEGMKLFVKYFGQLWD